MGTSISGGGGGRRRTRRWGRSSYRPMSDINVTPFVDVMLVLLIVFMVTAPLLTVGVPVDLPKTKAQAITEADEPLVITVNREREVFLQESLVEIVQLVPRLQAITQNKPDTRIYVRGDQAAPYGEVARVMAELQNAGFTRVALITKSPGSVASSAQDGDGN